MIVMKFGGTSVGSARAIIQLKDIVTARLSQKPIVVVSAMSGTTNRLLESAKLAVRGIKQDNNDKIDAIDILFNQLISQHTEAANELFGLSDSKSKTAFSAQFEDLYTELRKLLNAVSVLRELTLRGLDTIAAYGERCSSLLIYHYLEFCGIPTTLLDAREFIITDERFTSATPITEEINVRAQKAIIPIVEAGRVPITQGFIGTSLLTGFTTTIGRGGSDYTAALIGAAINAEKIEIWTDVDGLLTGDPRILPEVKKLKVIGFNEAAELAYFGAKVLHPATVLPAVRENIPVYILNSMRPEGTGTRIIAEAPPSRNPIKAIACRRAITVVNISSSRMLMAYGFLRRIFEIFDKYETAVDVVSTSEVSVSLTLDDNEKLAEIVAELSHLGDVTIEPMRAIICVVGTDLKSKPGIAGRVFKCIEEINIDMISQGASHINITLVVAEHDLTRAVSALHNEFFRELDPDLFEL